MTTAAAAAAWRAARLLARPVLAPAERVAAADLQLSADQWQRVAARAASWRWAVWLLDHAATVPLPLPPASTALLRQAAAVETRRTLAMDQRLQQLGGLWTLPEPPALLLKGRGIERRAYPPGTLRPIVDVDLVARPGHQARVAAVLTGLGLREVWRSRAGHVTQWLDREGGGVVELHEKPLDPWRFSPMAAQATLQAWFDGAVSAEGRLEPNPLDHTAFLLVHLVEGVYCDLRHRGDLAQWLTVVQPEPRAVLARLQAWQALRAGLTGLAVVLCDAPQLRQAWQPLLAEFRWAGPQADAAALTRRLAERRCSRALGPLPRWLEGAGLALHLDRPLRWGLTWTPARRWLPRGLEPSGPARGG